MNAHVRYCCRQGGRVSMRRQVEWARENKGRNHSGTHVMPDIRIECQKQEGLDNLGAPPAALECERDVCVDKVKTFPVQLRAPELAGDGEQTCEEEWGSLPDVVQRVQRGVKEHQETV